jgi:hypothetical protein
MSNENGSNNLLNLYREGRFEKLAQHDLGNPVDADGNTLMHVIASKLDKGALEKLVASNKQCITYTIINKPNKEGDCPAHRALKTIQNKGSADFSFISYIKNKLGADLSIPNKGNYVIAQNPGPMTEAGSTDSISKIVASSCKKSVGVVRATPPNGADNDKIAFIRRLTDFYPKAQSGGAHSYDSSNSYAGHRTIKYSSSENNFYPKFKRTFSANTSSDLFTESGKNDTFRTNLGNRMLGFSMFSSQDRIKRDPEITAKYNEILKKIMELLDLDEETARMYRSVIKLYLEEKNPELKGPTNDALKIKEMEKIVENKKKLKDYWDKKIGPEAEKIKERMAKQKELGEERKKKQEKYKAKDKAKNKPKITTPPVSESSVSVLFTSASESGADYHIDSTPMDRPKFDIEAIKRYNKILEKLKEYLDNDETKAREYRSVIKLYLERHDADLTNPALPKDQKDLLRIEKMEKIVEDKGAFEDFWAKITTKEKKDIKDHMAKQAKLAEERRASQTTSSAISTPTISSESSESESSSESEEKPKKKPKKVAEKKPAKKAKNGYIQSDELIFSSEAY